MIVSRTYMGEHHYGRRQNRNSKIIVRQVPAIVPSELWEAAQQVLRSNLIMAVRTDHAPFLLRGLIKRAVCGRTYAGMRMKLPQRDHRAAATKDDWTGSGALFIPPRQDRRRRTG